LVRPDPPEHRPDETVEEQRWGRFWGWDPKENGALLIVLWNAIILHARWGGYVRERGLMAMAIFGNVITSISWFGVARSSR
jgi:ABC-type transport system involved in cytochrome c biogenesis permease subunit